jgi:hypothetical protein
MLQPEAHRCSLCFPPSNSPVSCYQFFIMLSAYLIARQTGRENMAGICEPPHRQMLEYHKKPQEAPHRESFANLPTREPKMTSQLFGSIASGGLVKRLIAIAAGVCLFSGIALGNEHRLSDRYVMVIDPAAKQQLGEDVFNEVVGFFHAAEMAIETKNLKALMDLYSDNYKDGEHDKKSAEQIWGRIFARFDMMTTQHTMQLVNVAAGRNMVVFRCSGLLLGVPDPGKGPITIDNWAMQDHVLIKESGKWKLIGTYGTERKRLWFDKPMHPLF